MKFKTIKQITDHLEQLNIQVSEYKEDKNQIKDIIKVDYSKILEFYNSNEKNLVVYIGDGCNNIEKTIALGVLA